MLPYVMYAGAPESLDIAQDVPTLTSSLRMALSPEISTPGWMTILDDGRASVNLPLFAPMSPHDCTRSVEKFFYYSSRD
ncbi:MAG: hypothetical protein LBR89_03075, partial [Holosporales bacterium]|nr:hypothetical protein [Holosporales bacterium]